MIHSLIELKKILDASYVRLLDGRLIKIGLSGINLGKNQMNKEDIKAKYTQLIKQKENSLERFKKNAEGYYLDGQIISDLEFKIGLYEEKD